MSDARWSPSGPRKQPCPRPVRQFPVTYRSNAPVALDEGTSALDTATESALIRALDTIAPGRMLIVVAHRISTLRGANRSTFLEEGRITAKGTYERLLATSATFRTLAGIKN